jgi:hypothetical protein
MMRIAYKILVGEPPEKKPRGSWNNDIKINLREIRCEGVSFIELGQDKIACRVP